MNRIFVAICAAAAAALSAWPAMAGGYQYRYVDLPGAPQSRLLGINDRGIAVGDGLDIAGVPYISFQYDSSKKSTVVVPAAPGYSETDTLGINDFGVMVGAVTSLDGTTISAFIRGTDGKFKVFRQPGWDNSQARGINNAGLVCGFSYSADSSSFVGFIYDPRRNVFTSVLPSPITIIAGINNRGQVAGSEYLLADAVYPGSPQGVYSFVRNADGRVTLFRINGLPTRARGINDSGVIIGFMNDPITTYSGFAIRLQQSSGYQAITVPEANLLNSPLGGGTMALGIANTGVVSGAAFDAAGNSHGFVATPFDQ